MNEAISFLVSRRMLRARICRNKRRFAQTFSWASLISRRCSAIWFSSFLADKTKLQFFPKSFSFVHKRRTSVLSSTYSLHENTISAHKFDSTTLFFFVLTHTRVVADCFRFLSASHVNQFADIIRSSFWVVGDARQYDEQQRNVCLLCSVEIAFSWGFPFQPLFAYFVRLGLQKQRRWMGINYETSICIPRTHIFQTNFQLELVADRTIIHSIAFRLLRRSSTDKAELE